MRPPLLRHRPKERLVLRGLVGVAQGISDQAGAFCSFGVRPWVCRREGFEGYIGGGGGGCVAAPYKVWGSKLWVEASGWKVRLEEASLRTVGSVMARCPERYLHTFRTPNGCFKHVGPILGSVRH